MGIGLDSCLVPLRDNLFMVQSTDFFYPLIDDPYMMGKITCANVVSDVYATGVTEIDNLTMILSICDQMSEKECEVVMPLIIKGFQDNAKLANTKVVVDNAVYNPWCVIGGSATAVCTSTEYINPSNAQVGDVLVLTKPLGAQIACNANRWSENKERWEKISEVVTLTEVQTAFKNAVTSMARLNRTAAVLMHKHDAHGATDVTGFGLLGHANNLVKYQRNNVNFVIHTLPVLQNVLKVAEVTNTKEKFLRGTTPETSGGLLISFSKEKAEDFCKDIEELEGFAAWIIGTVENGDKIAKVNDNPNIIEVEY